MKTLRVAIVEDEEIQRRQVAAWVANDPHAALIGEAGDGESAVRIIDEFQPDVILLDVSLPGCSGLDVLQRITHKPEVIFTTAFQDHAVTAFELGAADYLLKPFGRDRLVAALTRVRERASEHHSTPTGDLPLADRVAAARDEGRPLERLFVRQGGVIVPVAVKDIERLDADGDYTAVLTAGRRFLVAVPLSTLHARIQRPDFVRVHRGHVVNLAHVARIAQAGDGRLTVELRTTGSVVASRAGSQALRGFVE